MPLEGCGQTEMGVAEREEGSSWQDVGGGKEGRKRQVLWGRQAREG